MNEPNERCDKCMTKYYRDLVYDLFTLIYDKLDEELLIKYLLTNGYKAEGDLINTLMFDRDYVEQIVNELKDEYQGEGI